MNVFCLASRVLTVLVLAHAAHAAQPQTTAVSPWQWGLSTGWEKYREPIMEQAGPQLGLASRWAVSEGFTLEAQVALARLSYDSVGSGSMSGVPQTELNLRLSGPAWGWGEGSRLEPTLHWQYTDNDLRGQSTTGNPGYERHLSNWWLGARWTRPTPSLNWPVRSVSLELQGLLKGQQQSHLSQANPIYMDVTTRTRQGWALTLQGRLPGSRGELVPYLRWQRLSRSNTVSTGPSLAKEPESTQLWAGVTWWLR